MSTVTTRPSHTPRKPATELVAHSSRGIFQSRDNTSGSFEPHRTTPAASERTSGHSAPVADVGDPHSPAGRADDDSEGPYTMFKPAGSPARQGAPSWYYRPSGMETAPPLSLPWMPKITTEQDVLMSRTFMKAIGRGQQDAAERKAEEGPILKREMETAREPTSGGAPTKAESRVRQDADAPLITPPEYWKPTITREQDALSWRALPKSRRNHVPNQARKQGESPLQRPVPSHRTDLESAPPSVLVAMDNGTKSPPSAAMSREGEEMARREDKARHEEQAGKRWEFWKPDQKKKSEPEDGLGSLRGRGNDHAEARKAKLRQDGSLADEDTPKQSEQQQRQAEKARRKDAEAKQETSPRPQGTQSSSSESSSASTSSTGSQSLNSTPSTSFAGSESSFGTGTQRAQYEGSATSARLDEVERQELEKHIVAAAELAVSRFRSSLNPIMRGQKHMPSDSNPVLEGIYHNLVEVIENKLGDVACLSSEQHFSVNAFRDCARPMLHMDIASALVWRHECRVHLLEMCPPLGLPLDHESVRDALYRDESHIALVLENILASEVQKGKVLNMANEEAEKFVDAVEEVLVAIPHARDSISTLLHKAHRFMTEVAESCGIIPTALKITGVEVHGSHPVFRGGYADLFKGDHCGTVVMLKRLHSRLELRDEAGTKRSRRKFLQEAFLWKNLNHSNVLPFLGVAFDTFPSLSVSLVSPFLQQGTVMDYLRKYGRQNVDVVKMLLQVAQGLQYLHSERVVHGDLKGTNILVDDEFCIRLADFGLSVFLDATISKSHNAGTVRWMAPELHDPETFGLEHALRTPASDMYAFSHVCMEIFTGREPFPDLREATVIYKVMNGHRPERPSSTDSSIVAEMPDWLWDLITLCWKHKPEERPTSTAVLDTIEGRYHSHGS